MKKYSHDDRKYIVELIENLKNDDDYTNVFKILMKDPSNSYSQNNNGVFLNLSVVSDNTLDKISKYLNKVNKKKVNTLDTELYVIPNTGSIVNDKMYKLSNYEKNIIKQRNLKKNN